MIFFGWGKKQKHWKTLDGKYLVVSWSYFHIFWCPIAFKIKWHLIAEDKENSHGHINTLSEEDKITAHIILEDCTISYDKVKEIIPEKTPDLSVWERYGLGIIIIGIAIINIWF
jgi:hypothetical protein